LHKGFFGGTVDFIQPDVQELLMQEDFEFRHLMEEHRAADERLSRLRHKPALTSRESIEAVELKKAKLRAKEKIYRIVKDLDKVKA
jgi:uncharacterized protein YdcH (DUF465 family)